MRILFNRPFSTGKEFGYIQHAEGLTQLGTLRSDAFTGRREASAMISNIRPSIAREDASSVRWNSLYNLVASQTDKPP